VSYWVEPVALTTPTVPRQEVLWVSGYNAPERWIKDMEACHYHLIGEYEINDKAKLLRFELDDKYRSDLVENAPKFSCVQIPIK
jgi:hypothetical protein